MGTRVYFVSGGIRIPPGCNIAVRGRFNERCLREYFVYQMNIPDFVAKSFPRPRRIIPELNDGQLIVRCLPKGIYELGRVVGQYPGQGAEMARIRWLPVGHAIPWGFGIEPLTPWLQHDNFRDDALVSRGTLKSSSYLPRPSRRFQNLALKPGQYIAQYDAAKGVYRLYVVRPYEKGPA